MDTTTERRRTPGKAALAAWSGSALEYYDLAIYGTAAALVFPKIFFPEGNDSAATIAAFATFGVAYVARPIGSFVMGHIGDRLGRKKVMVGTLLLMGVSTFLVGCLPTYPQVGLLAPALLVAAPAPPGPLGLRGAGRCQLDVLRARARRPARLLHQLHAQRHPGRPGARPGDLPAAGRGAARGPAAQLGLAGAVLGAAPSWSCSAW